MPGVRAPQFSEEVKFNLLPLCLSCVSALFILYFVSFFVFSSVLLTGIQS